MFILPQTAEYALRAVLHLAARHPQPVRVAELASAVSAPANYLSKTLNQLAHAGILASSRGPAGGFRLTKAPADVTLEAVVAVFVGEGDRRCLIGHGRCGHNPQCTVHAHWKPVAIEVDAFFASTTLADLLPDAPLAAAGGRP